MIPDAKVEQIQRLLAAGTHSMRKIARLADVSRGTVAAIAQGKRRPRPVPDDGDGLFEEPLGPLERCPQCGAMVYAPCRACRLKHWLRTRRKNDRPALREDSLELELTGDHRQRYEEVRARRQIEERNQEPPDECRLGRIALVLFPADVAWDAQEE